MWDVWVSICTQKLVTITVHYWAFIMSARTDHEKEKIFHNNKGHTTRTFAENTSKQSNTKKAETREV